jgi:uncharacterized membrane protein
MSGMQFPGNASRPMTCLVLVALVISMIPSTAIGVENPPIDLGLGVLVTAGDWLIEEGEDFTYTGEEIVVNGDITIEGSLTLTDCDVTMNDITSAITVHGSLVIENTTITGNGVNYYSFIVFGTMEFIDSDLSDMAGVSSPTFLGGLQIFSDDVTISGGRIHENEFTGLYVNANITISDLLIENNIYNIFVNNSAPEFIDCISRYADSMSLSMDNGAFPYFVETTVSGGREFRDSISSMNIGHRLSVHVVYENGTAIAGAIVTALSYSGDNSRTDLTGSDGWVHDMVLPEYTVHSGGGDTVYSPYYVTAEKFGLSVQELVPFDDTTEVEIILTGDYFGQEMTRGDFNGDGLQDLAVGVPRNASGTVKPGAVFVYLNRGDLDLLDLDESMADLTIPGIIGTDFGSVLAAGDINGDGYDELLLATPGSSENGADAGRVYFLFGEAEPAWDTVNDALLFFDGEPGDRYGSQLLCGNINGDGFDDFVIGTVFNSFVFFGSPDPVNDFTAVSDFTSSATTKGAVDDTTQSVRKTRYNDEDRYDLDPQEQMHLTNFTMGNIKGNPVEITLKFQFVTDRYFGYYQGERGYVYYSIDNENWHETVRPAAPNNNYNDETTLTFDLLADGVTSLRDLENIQIWYKNLEGTQGSDHYIHINYVQIFVSAIPSGANHTLPAGNLSIGDVNGDGHTDLLVADAVQQAVYFGGTGGISAPEIIDIEIQQGNASNLLVKGGNLTISETRPYLNGQFDDGWNGWIQTQNTQGQKDDGVRWTIIDGENGDWKVHESYTGGFGSDRDTIGGGGGGGGDCRGMLRTADFLITDDMEMIHFWYNYKASSFEPAGGNQGSFSDEIRYAFYGAENNTVLMELAGWEASSDENSIDEDGFADVNISSLHGQTVYFGIEIITNGGQGDRGLAQIDNITISPPSDIPYYSNGTFESTWFDFELNLTSVTPIWVQELNGGGISVKFRFDENETWDSIPDITSGSKVDAPGDSMKFQYRIEMTGDTLSTPFLGSLDIGYLLEGQMKPLYLDSDSGVVRLGDVNGDGADDLLFLLGESTRATGIDIHHGSTTISDDYSTSGITDFYDGEVNGFSFLDLEMDGAMEVAIAGPSVKILDGTGQTLYERDVRGLTITGNTVADPEFQLNTGAINFVPAYDNECGILNVDIPDLVAPDSHQHIDITIGNAGMNDVTSLTVYLNITADGYSDLFSEIIDLASMTKNIYSLDWDVPVEEGIEYTLTIQAPLKDDRVPGNNEVVRSVTSMKHGVQMISADPTASAHGGDPMTFPISLENIGTFEFENVSLEALIPVGWDGAFYLASDQVEWVIVTDTIDLMYVITPPVEEVNDDYTLNLSLTAESAMAYLELTATVLRPDLIVREIILFREDGVAANDTHHGVMGEEGLIMIEVLNQGPTYSGSFRTTLTRDSTTELEIFIHDGLESGETVWFEYGIVHDDSPLDLNVEIDIENSIPEMDEMNNDRMESFIIKDTTPVGDYQLSGTVVNIYGDGVDLAEVTLSWDDEQVKLFTDENGTFMYVISSGDYTDTLRLYINVTDGANITNEVIILYSEDGGKDLYLVLNQYIIEITGPDAVSSIETGGTASITVYVTNLGNTEAIFVITASELPEAWSVAFTGYPDGSFSLEVNESLPIEVVISSSADPLLSVGYYRYFLDLLVYSQSYPEASDTFSHGLQMEPYRSLLVTPMGIDRQDAVPFDMVSYSFTVENQGNLQDTFIPRVLGYVLQYHEFDTPYLVLEIGESAQFTLDFIMPRIASGTTFLLEVGSSEDMITNAEVFTTALDYYDVAVDLPISRDVKPGATVSIDADITNTGNLPQTISVSTWTDREGIEHISGGIQLDMDEEGTYPISMDLPLDAMSGEVILVYITIASEGSNFINETFTINVIESFGLDLTLMNTTIVPGPDLTTYVYEIEAVNTGNGVNTFHFRAEGTHPHYLSVPVPVELAPGEIATIVASIVVPINRTSVIDNYLVPTDGDHDFGDLNLRILSYSLDLTTTVTMRQAVGGPMVDGSGIGITTYHYDVNVTNNGDRFEHLSIVLKIPQVGTYTAGDRQWKGLSSKDVLDLHPGETGMFTVSVTTPEKREHWGTDLSLTLQSDSKKSSSIPLAKPPIAIMANPGDTTFTHEDTLTFIGSQSVWNILEYHWDFGDGTNTTGSTVDHVFRNAGQFTVTLTVTDDIGLQAFAVRDITISNIAPIASIVTLPTNRTVEEGKPIVLNGRFSQDRDGEIVLYSWDFGHFGDLFESSLPEIEHSYDQQGIYEVTLQVIDNLGGSSNTTVTITVIEATESIPTSTGDPVEEVTTDVISYVPMILVVLLMIVGMILIFRKRSQIKFIEDKIKAKEQS